MSAQEEVVALQQTIVAASPLTQPLRETAAKSSSHLMRRILREVAAGRYEAALEIASPAATSDPAIANARGVCLMRMGRHEDALALYRWLVLNPGLTRIRPDRPTHFKINYATALLLTGRPDGCLQVLRGIHEESPATMQLRNAITRWEDTLTFWQKLEWWVNGVLPTNQPVTMDFVPGDFGPIGE